MEVEIYLKAFGFGAIIWLVAALPLVAASVIVLLPGAKVPRKRLFVLVSSVLSYGIAVFVYVLFLPFFLLSTFFSPQWEAQGYIMLASATDWMAEIGAVLPYVAVVICSFVVPVLGRRKYWKNVAN